MPLIVTILSFPGVCALKPLATASSWNTAHMAHCTIYSRMVRKFHQYGLSIGQNRLLLGCTTYTLTRLFIVISRAQSKKHHNDFLRLKHFSFIGMIIFDAYKIDKTT
jgi:hypothetical protein